MNSKWLRVRKSKPCPICGRPDWCVVSEDGTAAICPRTMNNHPIKGGDGDLVGYLHKLDGGITYTPEPRRRPDPTPTRDMAMLSRQYETSIAVPKLEAFAVNMGLSVASLKRLHTGWAFDRRAWAFPMVDAFERIIGIRLRAFDGSKFCVTGSHNGLFVPTGLSGDGPLSFCEGPTSLAALLDWGYDAIGRPSCSAGVGLVRTLLDRGRRRDVVIFGDHDQAKYRPDGSVFYPGQDGAAVLVQAILPVCRSVKIVIPPYSKDTRSWKQTGATRAVVDAVIRAQNYVRLDRAIAAQGA